MAKVRNLKMKVVVRPFSEEDGGPNPFQRGSFKRALFTWALEQKEFTKGDFLAACLRLAEEVGYESEMSSDAYPRAWWNEFWSRHKCFRPVAD